MYQKHTYMNSVTTINVFFLIFAFSDGKKIVYVYVIMPIVCHNLLGSMYKLVHENTDYKILF